MKKLHNNANFFWHKNQKLWQESYLEEIFCKQVVKRKDKKKYKNIFFVIIIEEQCPIYIFPRKK